MKFSELFLDWKNSVEFQNGEVIYKQSDPAKVMYFIMKGQVELSLHDEILSKEKAGGIIGEMAMVGSSIRHATATALSDVILARVNRREFKELIAGNADFSFHVMTILADRLRAVDKFISSQFEQQK
jgi:CRP-like cAMP-binding protein